MNPHQQQLRRAADKPFAGSVWASRHREQPAGSLLARSSQGGARRKRACGRSSAARKKFLATAPHERARHGTSVVEIPLKPIPWLADRGRELQ